MKLNVAGATLAIFCLLYAAFAPAVAQHGEETCYRGIPGKIDCLKFFREPKTWSEAEETCIRLGDGGHLVSIHSASFQDTVDNLGRPFVNKEDSKYWIGAIGNKKEHGVGHTYTWRDGKPLDFKNWGRGEPNNRNHNEHCLTNDHSKGLHGEGKWNDDLCHLKLPFMCSFIRRSLP